MTITALSVQRFVAVRSPLITRGSLRLGKSCRRILIPAIWILSVFTMSPLAIVRHLHVEEPVLPIVEPMYFCTETWDRHARLKVGYSIFLLCFIYILPAILLLTLYLGITRRLAASEANIIDKTIDTSTSSLTNENIVLARRRAGHQCVLFAAFFVVCWLPYHVINPLIDAFVPDKASIHTRTSNQMLVDIYNIALLLAHTNSAINPLLYCFAGKRFRGGAMSSFHLHMQPIGNQLTRQIATPKTHRERTLSFSPQHYLPK